MATINQITVNSTTYDLAVSAANVSGTVANATTATKLGTANKGSATQPIYLNAGAPTACTYTLGKSVPSNAKFTDTTYSTFVKSGSSAAAGLVPKPSTTAGTTKYLREDGTWVKPPNTTYSNMGAATASAAGTAGLVPAPAAGAQAKFLRGDGTWQTPPTSYTLPSAGSSLGGVKSGGDVTISSGVITVKDDSHNHVISNVDGLQSALDGKAASDHSHSYLPLSGGIITGTGSAPLRIKSGSTSTYIQFKDKNDTSLGYYGVNASKQPVFYNSVDSVILHAGNYTSYTRAKENTVYVTDSASALNCNSIYDAGIYLIANGTNSPTSCKYGSLLSMPYRKSHGNTTPDFCAQLFMPNGDNATNPDALYYRTSTSTAYRSWIRVLDTANYSSYALPLSGGTMSNPTIKSSGSFQFVPNNSVHFVMNSNSSGTSNVYINNKFGNGTNAQLIMTDYSGSSTVSAGQFGITTRGTTSAEGVIRIVLGNSKTSTTACNYTGEVDLYAKTGYGAMLRANTSQSSHQYVYLPKSGTIATSSSDVRLKENIKDTDETDALALVNSIKFRQFDWKESGKHQKLGVVADELEQIDEHLIIEGTGGYNGEDEDGNPMINVKCVDTFYLMGYYGKAIQEMSNIIDNLQREIEELKSKVK